MKAGIYLRVSTDMQVRDGESLAEQEATCQAFCNFKNISIVNVYREEGKSGKDTNRPQFQRMIKDCTLGNIDTIIVKKVDRLSRSLIDFEKTIKFFEDHNVNLISIQENFDTSTAIGRAVIRIILTFAQLEREQTSERTIDVLKFRAEQGQWNGGYPPLGYNYDKELGLLINKDEALTVKLIYDKYIELASYKKTADCINGLGYRTKAFNSRRGRQQGGNKFIDTSIAGILKNPVYIGQIRYKGQICQGKHQAIMDKEKFNKVQEIIKRNNITKSCLATIGNHNFLLEGLVKCGQCGSVMAPKWSLAHGRRYFYYECTSAGHGGKTKCNTKAIPAPALESVILRRIRMIKRDEDLLAKIIGTNTNSFQREIFQLEAEKIILNIKHTETANKATSIVDKLLSIAELSHSQILYDEVDKIEKEKAGITKRIQELDFTITQLKNRAVNMDTARQAFQYSTQVYSKLEPLQKKLLLQLLIKEITYNQKEITINFFDYIDTSYINNGCRTGAGWPRLWTGSDVSSQSQNYRDNFSITTYRKERGKYYYEIANCLN